MALLAIRARQHGDDEALAALDVGVLPIHDRFAKAHFDFVFTRSHVDFLRPVVVFGYASALHVVNENDRPRGCAGDDEFGRIGGRRRFAMEPAAGAQHAQRQNREVFQT